MADKDNIVPIGGNGSEPLQIGAPEDAKILMCSTGIVCAVTKVCAVVWVMSRSCSDSAPV